jgi:hypothetical protein
MIESKIYTTTEIHATLPGGNGGFKSGPNLRTEGELIIIQDNTSRYTIISS